jgi:hypothetical protein
VQLDAPWIPACAEMTARVAAPLRAFLNLNLLCGPLRTLRLCGKKFWYFLDKNRQ